MMPTLAAVAVVATLLVSRTDGARMRLRRKRPRGLRPSRRGLLTAIAPAAAGIWLLGPTAMAITVVAVAALVVKRLVRPASSAGSLDVALTLDVLAGCLAAGASMPAALVAAQVAAPARVRNAFAATSLALGRGDDPDATWLRFGADVPELAPVGRLCSRAAVTGAAVAAELHRLAAAQRTALDTSRRRRLQRASVWLVLPLGLCFLPAFVLVGVVPLVVGAMPAALHGH